jgi:predicted MPP superfamily phosphohydrolase
MNAPTTSRRRLLARRLTRRQFLGTILSIGGASGLALAYTRLVEPHWLEIVHRDLPLADLPAELNGRTLVQLSDLHIGPQVDDDFILDVFRRVALIAPDFVVVTGDWISYRGPEQLQQLDRLLGDFPRGRLGTVGILGNHDFGGRWRMAEVADDVVRHAQDHGVVMLRNSAARLAGLQFIGLDDYWGPCFFPGDVLREHGSGPATIVLCHNPDVADEPVWHDFRGWILAGHTHGGQCKPPFLPPPLLPVRNRRYTCGEFDVGGGRRMYVNRAVGHLLSVRFNVRPEVTVFRLRPAIG